jgi:hypothetical protein
MPSHGRRQQSAALLGVTAFRRQEAAAARLRRIQRRREAERRRLEKKTVQFGHALLSEIEVPGYQDLVRINGPTAQDRLVHRVIPMLQGQMAKYPK